MAEGEVVWEDVYDRAGVTLRKSLEDPIRNPPMAKYELSTTRGSPVPVRIVEQIPSELSEENVGFVSSAGRTEGWRIDGIEMVYEADLEPGAPTRSAIAARGMDVDVIRDLAGEPKAFEVEEPSPDRPAAPREAADGGSDGIGAALAAELRSDELTAEDLTELRQALGHDPGSVDVNTRIEQLQTDVADLRADRRVLRAGVDELEERLETVERSDETVCTLRDDIADVEHELYRFEKTLNSHTADIRSLERTVEGFEDRLSEDFRAVNDFVAAMRQVSESTNEPEEDED